ncbi:MAG: hypothetical protein OXC11_02330 [Rhodospirillales bacterium]|nr:hypothetical protein [Rhodospirillales bacterium]
MSDNPYRIPDDGIHRVINFSGGRSSAYMLWHILAAHGGELPPRTVVCFANTGEEAEGTLTFVNECEFHWQVPIVWLEYRYRPDLPGRRPGQWRHQHQVVGYVTACTEGEPYDQMIESRKMLPNISMSFCTSDLKVLPIRWYVERELGWKERVINVLGIRHDEPKRIQKALFEECDTEYPLHHAKVDEGAVRAFWDDRNFDLRVHPDDGNCTRCWKKGKAMLVRGIRRQPASADRWVAREQRIEKNAGQRGLVSRANATFSKRHTYADLVALARDQGELDLPDDPGIDCFCGD